MQTINPILWKARRDPQVMIYSIVSILNDPGCDIGHPMIVISPAFRRMDILTNYDCQYGVAML